MDFSAFYTDTMTFSNYGLEHFFSVLVVAVFGLWFLRKGKYSWDEKQKWKYVILFAAVLYGIQLFKTFIRLYLGNFDITEDLPLQLCNILPLILMVALYYKSRIVLSVVFFWILAGTAQANITPTLFNTFPHYESIRYWAIHTGLPVIAIYLYYVLGYRFQFKDAVRSALALNILAAIIYPLNLALGSNYLYLNAKPPGTTIYNLLGPWPWYIMNIEFVMLVLFSAVLIPFYIYERVKKRQTPLTA
ncbi:MAG: TIGR02206 family membrane protein [Saprospiraceae bacterium]|nr:TIGR02206 family membrane protein [Saprospiraceae bacterium]